VKRAVPILAAIALTGCINYSDGARVGVVQKISHKGIVFKTYEGELVQAGIRARANGAVTDIWKFSVQDPAVVKQVEQAAETGQPVKLTYEQDVWNAPWVAGTSYRIVKVEPIKG
jgi:hypothetical protein